MSLIRTKTVRNEKVLFLGLPIEHRAYYLKHRANKIVFNDKVRLVSFNISCSKFLRSSKTRGATGSQSSADESRKRKKRLFT